VAEAVTPPTASATRPGRLRADMTAALVVLFIAWLAAWALPLTVVAGAVGLAQLLFVVAPPLPLTDVFN
jgi:membrane protein YqaA with SNARE-associated domain